MKPIVVFTLLPITFGTGYWLGAASPVSLSERDSYRAGEKLSKESEPKPACVVKPAMRVFVDQTDDSARGVQSTSSGGKPTYQISNSTRYDGPTDHASSTSQGDPSLLGSSLEELIKSYPDSKKRASLIESASISDKDLLIDVAQNDPSPSVRAKSIDRMANLESDQGSKVFEEQIVNQLSGSESDGEVLNAGLNYMDRFSAPDKLFKTSANLLRRENLSPEVLTNIREIWIEANGNVNELYSLIVQSPSFQNLASELQQPLLDDLQ